MGLLVGKLVKGVGIPLGTSSLDMLASRLKANCAESATVIGNVYKD